MSIVNTLMILSLLIISSGCATIIQGTTQEVGITTDPPEANLLVDGKENYKSPAKITMKRKDDHLVEVTKEGFEKVMKRFQEMGFKGLLPYPSHPVPKGRLIPPDSPQGLESITSSQLDFTSYLLEKLNWDEGHYHAFCDRIIKRPDPLTKREGQKIVIGLMAILRHRTIKRKKS